MANKLNHESFRLKLKEEVARRHNEVSIAAANLEQALLDRDFIFKKQAAYYLISTITYWTKIRTAEYKTVKALNEYVLRRMGHGKEAT